MAAAGRRFDAIVIACFDDTGLAEARALAPCPVLGIGQAAYLAAVLLGRRFSVVTTLAVSVPILEANLAAYGLAAACAGSGPPAFPSSRSSGPRTRSPPRPRARVAEDGAAAVVLGCAGMAGLSARLAASLAVPVIDGVAAATRLATAAAHACPNGTMIDVDLVTNVPRRPGARRAQRSLHPHR